MPLWDVCFDGRSLDAGRNDLVEDRDEDCVELPFAFAPPSWDYLLIIPFRG